MPFLDWYGRKAVENYHQEVPFHLLRSIETNLLNKDGNSNLVVKGDNLLALRALLPYYAGQIKCIYIDPPYNTGSENWVYNDNVNSPEIRQWLGKVVGREAEDLSRHDKWLCMMYPRLRVMKDFLREDGVIMVSIDDFEVYHLRAIMNEIFGLQNFIAQLVWDKTRKNDAKLFSVGHEYILIYARSLSYLRKLGTVWREAKPGAKEIVEKYNSLKALYGDDYEAMEAELRIWYRELPKGHPSKALSRYKHIDKDGVWRDRDISWPGGGGPRYDVVHPGTGQPCKIPEAGWRFSTLEKMQQQIDLGLVVFRDDHTDPPFRKAYINPITSDVYDDEDEIDNSEEAGLQVMPSIIYKQAQVSVKLLRNIFDGEQVFPNPKDHEVLMRIFKYITGPEDIILDAFAGSGSTGHAVLQLNRDERGSKRRFILIEMDESIFSNVTTQRLKRVIEGYSYTTPRGRRDEIAGLGGGFHTCELGPTVFSSEGRINENVTFTELAHHIFFAETNRPLSSDIILDSPLIGENMGTAIYLLFNGILKDKSPQGGNVLTTKLLNELPRYKGPKVIYGTSSRIGTDRLKRENIIFRQIPYEIRWR